MFCEVYDIVAYLIMTCDDDLSVRAAHHMTYQKGLHSTIVFVLEVRGVNVVTIKSKTTKLCCGKYCTSKRGTLYALPVTCVFGAEENAFLEGPLVADYYPEFCGICGIQFPPPSRFPPLTARV